MFNKSVYLLVDEDTSLALKYFWHLHLDTIGNAHRPKLISQHYDNETFSTFRLSFESTENDPENLEIKNELSSLLNFQVKNKELFENYKGGIIVITLIIILILCILISKY